MTQHQSKNKILVFIILLLLLTNILVVWYFLYSCKPPSKDKGRDYFITLLQKEVGFNQQQLDSFKVLKKSHWEQAKNRMGQIIRIKNNIFDLTKKANTPDSVVEKLADSIGLLQKQVEIDAYKHVVATRKICTPEQQTAYDSLMKKIINRGGRYEKTPNKMPPPNNAFQNKE